MVLNSIILNHYELIIIIFLHKILSLLRRHKRLLSFTRPMLALSRHLQSSLLLAHRPDHDFVFAASQGLDPVYTIDNHIRLFGVDFAALLINLREATVVGVVVCLARLNA